MLNTKDAPGTATAAERQPDGTERPDEGQEREPAGSPNGDDQGAGKPTTDAPKEQPAAAADGKKADGAEAEDTPDYKAKYEDTETKRRDIQSKYDKLAKEHGPEATDRKLKQFDEAWRQWIQRNAPDAYEKLSVAERERGQAREGERNARARSDSTILGVYRDGDKAFGDYLTDLADGGATISPQSLERHRETFNKYRSNSNGNGDGKPAAKGDEPPKPAPPRTPGAGRPAVEAAPAWDGKTWGSRAYLTEGLAKRDANKEPRRQPAGSR